MTHSAAAHCAEMAPQHLKLLQVARRPHDPLWLQPPVDPPLQLQLRTTHAQRHSQKKVE